MENVNSPMNPMELPAEIRVNVLLNEMLNLVEHMTHLKQMIDQTMSELAGNDPHHHVHDENCNHDHDSVRVDDSCCGDPDCSSKEEE